MVCLLACWLLAWFLSGDPGDRFIVPITSEAMVVFVTVFGTGLVVVSALRIIETGGPGRKREAVIWIAAMICLGLGYGSRAELIEVYDRLRGNIYPSVALTTAQGEAELRRHGDGHYLRDRSAGRPSFGGGRRRARQTRHPDAPVIASAAQR